MMPSAGEVFLVVVKRRNSIVTYAASPASRASAEADYPPERLVTALSLDYAMTWCGVGSRPVSIPAGPATPPSLIAEGVSAGPVIRLAASPGPASATFVLADTYVGTSHPIA